MTDDDSLLSINGLNAATGGYLTPPLSPEDVSRLALGESVDPEHLEDQQARVFRDSQESFAPVEGVDPNDLAQSGWGVIFTHDADPVIRDALKELLDFRRAQAGAIKPDRYREYQKDAGYQVANPRENKRYWLFRNGTSSGQAADPDKVPYYLLIVGDPAAIPYRFQYQLDVEYAVGRIWFEGPDGKPDLEAFAHYARSVVDAESGRVPLARRASFVGVENSDDRATKLSAQNLVRPLADQLGAERKDWTVLTHFGDQAKKAALARLMGGPETPAFLFTASHGIGFPNGDPRQTPDQGGLVCQDWLGPLQARNQPIGKDVYFAGDDLGADARLLGMIAFHFACYGAGTPDLDDFAFLRNLQATQRNTIAARPFLARLPQRLLGHPKGGALATIGHVERAWGCSFFGAGKLGQQLQTFKSTLTRLLLGHRVGWALEYFNQYYAALASDLSEVMENIRLGGRVPDNQALSEMWTQSNDARSFIVVGDPAVRLTFPDGGLGDGNRPEIAPPSIIAPPQPSPQPPPSPDPVPSVSGSPSAFDLQVGAAESRFGQREATRESFAVGGSVADRLVQRNNPDRIRRRLARLGVEPEAVETFLADPGASSFALLSEKTSAAETSAALPLERILGRNDMVGGQFLDSGASAARPVGRIRIRSASGRTVGFGTGSLIAPRLLLTNNHVLPSAGVAATSVVEFNVQEGRDGRPLTATEFALTPDQFFVTDPALDFALVAVAEQGAAGVGLASFGFNPAREDDDPVLVEEYVNIVQHPGGRPKQVALRDNQVIDLLDDFLHYRADTEPGSSGSPVFNDQWEIVGLHHSGVPRRDPAGQILSRDGTTWTPAMGENSIDWIANEGVRLSRILGFVRAATLGDGAPTRLRDSLFAAIAAPRTVPTEPPPMPTATRTPNQPETAPEVTHDGAGVVITIPIEVQVRVGGATTSVSVAATTSGASATRTAPVALGESVTIDPEYGNREGYDPEFLGAGVLRVALPQLSDALKAQAARLDPLVPGADPFELKYHHFSVIQHQARRLAIFTAVNIDGRTAQAIRRDTDRWFFDPRIDRAAQVGDSTYNKSDFDRGHLVRRLDPAWGRTERVAQVANDDTFHFTNCSLQHARFNRGKTLWAGLENYLLDRAGGDRKRLTVFTGPVFAADDPVFRGVQIPRQYWKVAVIARPNGQPSALGFLVSQAELLTPAVLSESTVDVARTFQVPVRRVEELSGLDFGSLRSLDAASAAGFGREADAMIELETLDDIELSTGAAGEESRPGGDPESFAITAPFGATSPSEAVPGTNLRYDLLVYDSDAQDRTPDVSRRLVATVSNEPITDVWLISHGWRGDIPAARAQYESWIRAMAESSASFTGRRPGFRPLLIGIHWPSEPWGDETLAGAASFAVGEAATDVTAVVDDLAQRLGDKPGIREPLRTIVAAAQTGAEPDHLPPDVEAAYRALDRALGLGSGGVAADPGSDREPFDPDAVYQEALADSGPSGFALGLPGWGTLMSPFKSLSFWTMKDRGRRIGEGAIHPLLRRLMDASSGRDVRFHMMGHSFGCVVASAAVAGPPGSAPLPKPLNSLALIQGALSLWSYCGDIPYDRGTSGYFRRVVEGGRVRGPIITTQSRFDTAVGTWYPRAAWTGGQVAFGLDDLPKYGGVGSYGIQGPGIPLTNFDMHAAGPLYGFQPGKVYNLESSRFINEGGGVAGAHSDFCKPAIAFAVWEAAMAGLA